MATAKQMIRGLVVKARRAEEVVEYRASGLVDHCKDMSIYSVLSRESLKDLNRRLMLSDLYSFKGQL